MRLLALSCLSVGLSACNNWRTAEQIFIKIDIRVDLLRFFSVL
jgi:hypothetical protein